MTTLELITSSLRAIGQLTPGRAPSTTEANDALFVLNAMLDSWSTERLTVYHIPRDIYPLTGGDGDYTIGAGGDFDTERPIRIERAGIIIDQTETPIEVIRDQTKWADVWMKSTLGIPSELYVENSYPLMGLHLYAAPEMNSTLVLYPWRQLGAIASVTDPISYPPGYADAIRYSLAVRLAVEWQRTPQRPGALRELHELARDSKAAIKSINITYPEMSCDAGLLAIGDTSCYGWNWRTGE